ncbi:hypothetical protein [Nocardioides antri]|uniref:DUF2567 domain-containing protein n=1 Tax=Nocardioides antri TaxID=2607659 RepID=A0A5B1M7M5_9ACTN|nr:hypothetical protein [Nocardioides antri]KAA1429012.1 hypothetical protein F0U47_02045 [Nocardioides antri]
MTEQQTVPPPPAPADERRRVAWRDVAVVGGAVVVASAAVGALGGWLWYLWWGPPAPGKIFETDSGIKWYPDPWDPGQHQVFAGTAEYALIGLAGGVLLGFGAVVVGRRQAFAALAALVVGSALAAYVAFLVGTTLSPPDPQGYATADHVGEEYPAAIEVTGWTPYLLWPAGALIGFCSAVVLLSGAGEVRRQQVDQQQAGNWLEPVKTARSEQSPQP